MEVERKRYRSVWAKGTLYCEKGDPLHPENCTQSTESRSCSAHAHLNDGHAPDLLFTCLLCNETNIRYRKIDQHKKRKHPDLPKRGDIFSESKKDDEERAPEDLQQVSEMDDEADSVSEKQVLEDNKGEEWVPENQVGDSRQVRALRIGVVEPVWSENKGLHIDGENKGLHIEVQLLRQLFPQVNDSVVNQFRQEQGSLNYLDAALCVMDSFELVPTKIVKVWSMKDFLEKIDDPQEMDSLDAIFCCNWFDFCFWLSRKQPGSSTCPSIYHTIMRQVGSKLRKLQCERKIVIFPSIDCVSYFSSKSSYYADLCAKMPNSCGLLPTRLMDPYEVAFDSKLQCLIAEEHMNALIVDEANNEHLVSNMEDLRKLRENLPSRAVLVAHQLDKRVSRRAYRFLFIKEKILLRFTWSCVPFPFKWQRSTSEDLELLPSNFGEIVIDVGMNLKQIFGASALVCAIDMILNVESADLEVFRIVPLKAEEFVSVGSYDVDEIRSLLGLLSAIFHDAFHVREWKALSK